MINILEKSNSESTVRIYCGYDNYPGFYRQYFSTSVHEIKKSSMCLQEYLIKIESYGHDELLLVNNLKSYLKIKCTLEDEILLMLETEDKNNFSGVDV